MEEVIQKDIQHTEARLSEFLRKKMGKQINTWTITCSMSRQVISEEDVFYGNRRET
jgi:hypothetical protein